MRPDVGVDLMSRHGPYTDLIDCLPGMLDAVSNYIPTCSGNKYFLPDFLRKRTKTISNG